MVSATFYKLEASGNDFILFDARRQEPISLAPQKIAHLCDRHFGIGGDQLIILHTNDQSDLFLQLYNSDGSKAKQCGNGLRAISHYLFAHTPTATLKLFVGNERMQLSREGKGRYKVIFPTPTFSPIPQGLLSALEGNHLISHVNTGNAHIIIWQKDLASIDLASLAQRIATGSYFPDGVNMHVVSKNGPSALSIKHWERGAGETLACGSGAIAAVFDGQITHGMEKSVTVSFTKDTVAVQKIPDGYALIGGANLVFQGAVAL